MEQTDQFIKLDPGLGVPLTFYTDEIKSPGQEPSSAANTPQEPTSQTSSSVFLIGQDVQSIDDFMSALGNSPLRKDLHSPDGIMVYTAINDPRGLSESVDHGAGTNFADDMLRKYPDLKIVQIGLYMKYMLKETVQGGLDNNIDQIGQWIKRCGKQVYLRIGYEFDNRDNEYDPETYILAYRHIVDRLRALDISNVHFVWHSIAWKAGDWPDYAPMKWYPGDAYVDWMGISFFDAQRDEERIAFTQLASYLRKPLMISESSPFNQQATQDKLQWLKKLFEYMKEFKVTFLSYINVNWDTLPLFKSEKWGDARLENSPVLMNEFLSQIEQFRLRH